MFGRKEGKQTPTDCSEFLPNYLNFLDAAQYHVVGERKKKVDLLPLFLYNIRFLGFPSNIFNNYTLCNNVTANA